MASSSPMHGMKHGHHGMEHMHSPDCEHGIGGGVQASTKVITQVNVHNGPKGFESGHKEFSEHHKYNPMGHGAPGHNDFKSEHYVKQEEHHSGFNNGPMSFPSGSQHHNSGFNSFQGHKKQENHMNYGHNIQGYPSNHHGY